MKKYIYVVIFLFAFTSCKFDDSDLFYNDSPFVIFPSTSTGIFEGIAGMPDTKSISIERATGDLSKPVTVNFKSSAKFITGPNTGSAAPNSYSMQGEGGTSASVVIPAGKITAKITITSIDNATSDGYKEISIELESADDANIKMGYPGPAQLSKIARVTIFDDEDTSFNLLKFFGDRTVNQTPIVPSDRKYLTTFTESSVTNGIVNNKFLVTLEGPLVGEEKTQDYETVKLVYILTPSNGTSGTLRIPAQEFPAPKLDPLLGATSRPSSWVIDGNGTYNNTTGNMTASYRIRAKNASGAFINGVVQNYTHNYAR